MIDIEINSEDLRILHERCNRLMRPDLFQDALRIIGMDIQAKTGRYPPATIANDPSNPRGWWYERGFGTRFASGASYHTSEDLGKKWYTRTFPSYVEVGNTASYSPWVHGPEQARFHGERGWKKLLETATGLLPELLRKMAAQVERIWAGGTA